jgi:hypothetical protein
MSLSTPLDATLVAFQLLLVVNRRGIAEPFLMDVRLSLVEIHSVYP